MESLRSLIKNNILSFAYIGCCLLLSLPFLFGVLTIVNSHLLPSGYDNTVHSFFINKILETGNPLIEYSPFSDLIDQDTSRYYPSLMHIILSITTYIFGFTSPLQIVSALNTFIILVSIAGAIGFSLLVKEILKISLFNSYRIKVNEFGFKVRIYFILLCILVFGILIFSTFLILKTINDGSYAEVFAMWTIFPFYMIFLIRNSWIKSGILLSIIGATHNLSLIMALAVTIAYLFSFLINRKWKLLKRSTILFIVFGILSIPSFIFFYIPTIQGVANNTAGNVQSLPLELIRESLTPVIYYSAMAAAGILIILNYRRLSWLSVWIGIYFAVMSFFPIISTRMARESSIAFSMIIGICLAYSINFILFSENFRKFIKRHPFLRGYNLRIMLVLFTIVIVLPVYLNSQYGRLLGESNSFVTYYYSAAQHDSYQYLLSSYINRYNNDSTNIKDDIIVYGYSPWLKTLLYDQYNVYEASSKDYGDQFSSKDREINEDLLSIVQNPASQSSACILKEFDIDYVYIADNLFHRFYTSHQYAVYYEELNLLRFFTSPFLHLEKEFHGDHGERVQIYKVNALYADNYC